ncbi:endoglucanase [Gordonia desulfuricans]|uniref:Endoglucanase n=1 Tax=Gordonia desulfuricans TaxID=89051 RepID=A0A7K3LPC6_9ACTN|nr:glycosyl hydrolase [Gordonia desulfuricans]NDK90089.1 endoglucanase [Gordonia desulfuricans]
MPRPAADGFVGRSRRDVLRLTGLGALALTATACVSTACASTAEQPAAPSTPPPAGQRWGAFIPSVVPSDSGRSPITQLTALAGSAPAYLHRFCAIGDAVPTADLDAIAAAGATPLLTLEPWRPDSGLVQPEFALSRIAAGAFDTELTRWGRGLAEWGKPVLLRFAQEMNGTWYPWAVGVNGTTAADYRATFGRVRSVITAQGAAQVRFVWAPNAITLGTNPFADAFPGADQVDVLGVDGYNWGEAPGHHWQAAGDLFTPSLEALRSLDGEHPILITEVASADGPTPDQKAAWIRDFFGIVHSQPRVEGFVWFQTDKERDWRFNSSSASLEAFRAGVAALR